VNTNGRAAHEEYSLLAPVAEKVAIAWGPKGYDTPAPFCPGTAWPEYQRVASVLGDHANEVYQAVRESFQLLGCDSAHYGSPDWNPLGGWIRPGDTVVLKPNFVRDFRESSADTADCVITHGAIIRAVLDYAYLALGGRGRVIIADAPQNDADFSAIKRITRLDAIVDFYRRHVGFPVEVYDLRPEAAIKVDGVIIGHRELLGDPEGYVKVNLGPHSAFSAIEHLCGKLYGAEYDRRELVSHHTHGVHEYLIAKTILNADCVISLPKLKTHKKTGVTVNMKNLVGINGNKNWLPHHREGTPAEGGDQFNDSSFLRRSERLAVALFKRSFPMLGALRGTVAGPIKALGKSLFGDTNVDTVRSGNWFGNDTTWRMAVDLNRILHYADRDGTLHKQPMRRFLSVVDGIVGGEGNGPLDPQPKPSGVILAGTNPVVVDLVAARLMGFDYRKLPMIHKALEAHALPLASCAVANIKCLSNDQSFNRAVTELEGALLAFAPHFGWRGHIEVFENHRETRAVA
jgi:uncharacterized protein (DUF362 family)